MATCSFTGNSGMYGLGIRIAFYLIWFGGPIATVIAPGEASGMRFFRILLSTATFVALVIEVGNNVDALQVVEVYIVLLLVIGSSFRMVPLYLWKLITGCQPEWDPLRFPAVNPGLGYRYISFGLLLGATIFQLWFWFNRVPDLDQLGCTQYGFFFSQARLNARWFEAINIVVYFLIVLACGWVLLMGVMRHLEMIEEGRRPKITKSQARTLQELDLWNTIITVSVVIAAIELTIQWNDIKGVNGLGSAAQLIPLTISGAQLLLVLFRWAIVWEDSEDGSETDVVSVRSVRSMRSVRSARYWQRSAWPGMSGAGR